MMAIVLMVIVTAAAVFFLVEMGKASRIAAAEIVLSKAWSNRFARQALEEKKADFLEKNEKYHTVPDKKVAAKVKEWDKQIAAYWKNEEAYLAGRTFSLLDLIPLMGYQLLVDLKLDGNNDMLRNLTASCEHTGYVELERSQETGGRKNSSIYAYYLIASLISCLFLGVILACFMATAVIAAENEGMGAVLPVVACFAGIALYGYIPYDNIRSRAAKRQEEIELGFPNAISKITLLVTAGMNIVKAIEETAASDNSLMCRELRIAVDEMARASTVQGAFMRLQSRCSDRYVDKLVTIITKSYVSGNANLAADLREINEECWLDKKHNTRRMGEKIQNKLFVPTMMMFIGILVVIIVPAMAGFKL